MKGANPINVDDFRKLAKKRLPPMIFDYLEGGAEGEFGLQHNRNVLREIRFQPRRLRDVSRRDSTILLFEKSLSAPLLVAPTGLNDVFWPKGDIALARAAAKAGIPFILSTASNTSIEDVARHSDGDLWFQLYVVHRTLAEQLVNRALATGYSTLVLTADVAVNGYRERDLRNNFKLPMPLTPSVIMEAIAHPHWSWGLFRHGLPKMANFMNVEDTDIEAQTALMRRQMDASFNWGDLTWLRHLWPRRLVVKGITHPADAAQCIACGADGVILSNHGGRQLDDCLSPMEVLSATVAKISQPVLIDSGFRRGSDVVKAIALGATAVLLGRAALYGLAAKGESGVNDVLRLLKLEIDRTLAQIGCPSVTQLSQEYLL
jgi:(S)-mandelate dehydrogenase